MYIGDRGTVLNWKMRQKCGKFYRVVKILVNFADYYICECIFEQVKENLTVVKTYLLIYNISQLQSTLVMQQRFFWGVQS